MSPKEKTPVHTIDTVSSKEKVKPEKMINLPAEVALKYAITTAHYIHAGDTKLVLESARHHGVSISDKGALEPIEEHSYNFRVPHGDRQNKAMKAVREQEFKAIMEAKHLVVGCMDYRQSHLIASRHPEEEKPFFFFTAGGCVQPTDDRFSADVRFVAIAARASGADVDLYYHTGVCGGANYFTQGEMKQVHEHEGLEGEIAHMDPYAMGFAQELVEFGVNQDRIHIHRVDINDQNEVMGIIDIPYAPRQPMQSGGILE
jgi:hypothetical protein